MSNRTRRKFLNGCLQYTASASLLGLMSPLANSVNSQQGLYVSAARLDGQEGIAGVSLENNFSQLGLSGFRGHQVVGFPGDANKVLMVGRRPERRVLLFNLATGHTSLAFETENDEHLFGHACFDLAGEHIYTTEASSDSEQGHIVVRDAVNFEVVDRFSSYGVGPHQFCMSADGKKLIVANGGILTRPNSGRKALNLNSMQPSLVFIDLDTYDLVERHTLPARHASIRHIDVNSDDIVSVAIQFQREAVSHNRISELCALYKPDTGLQVLKAPDGIYSAMNDYVGSTVINAKARVAGFTSPRGNLAVFWKIDTEELLGYHRFHDVCGITVDETQEYFVLSNSAGEIRHIHASNMHEEKSMRRRFDDIAWDNHMTRI